MTFAELQQISRACRDCLTAGYSLPNNRRTLCSPKNSSSGTGSKLCDIPAARRIEGDSGPTPLVRTVRRLGFPRHANSSDARSRFDHRGRAGLGTLEVPGGKWRSISTWYTPVV